MALEQEEDSADRRLRRLETVLGMVETVERQYYCQPLNLQSRQPPPSMRSSTRRRIVEYAV